MRIVGSLGRRVLDAVAPRHCAACDEVSDAPICALCLEHLRGLRVPAAADAGWLRVLAGFTFDGPVREVLHRGKFQGNRAALAQIAELTAARLELDTRPAPDAVVPIPLGRKRQRQRGYNQAEVVARVLAEAGQAPLLPGLRRQRETGPQSSLGEAERRSNVAGAFTWEGAELTGARLWLADDVLTTGATLAAAAEELRQAGAAFVGGIVVARVL